jgi:hypothetical protein
MGIGIVKSSITPNARGGKNRAAESVLRSAKKGVRGMFHHRFTTLSSLRLELVFEIRDRIAAGVYDAPELLDVALDCMIDHVGCASAD